MKPLAIILPALKKTVAFPDDLIKKINGVTLIQHSINTAFLVTEKEHIFLITDSEEISLIAERNGINCYYQKNYKFSSDHIIYEVQSIMGELLDRYDMCMIYWSYTPTVTSERLLDACEKFIAGSYDVLITTKEEKHTIYRQQDIFIKDIITDKKEKFFFRIRSFMIFRTTLFAKSEDRLDIFPYLLNDDVVEINNYQDWWICEKILKRKRIVFRVIGNDLVGMGHIYRSLALAHEISDHEIIFLCDEKDSVAVNKIAGHDYLVETSSAAEIENKIITMRPDLVINDMLDTTREYMNTIRKNNIKVINFEDLGTGASFTDITINELYDEPVISGNNILWGSEYYFLRDEFLSAQPHKSKKKVSGLLLTFGGTDQNNLTQSILNSILALCKEYQVYIFVVVGGGYPHKEKLVKFIESQDYKNIDFTYATGIISKYMEKAEIAISSNGRTVYELAHMHIPSIIISHHERESTHRFSVEENGFIHVGVYEKSKTEKLVTEYLLKMICDESYRKQLLHNIKKFNFTQNKSKIVKLVTGLLAV
jgi:spore coat polysaccharide biosynthesis predicted glycosyltransferase SpsG/CMP-2-keto-3-deoxyoctulosonic acid synthetase